MPQNKKNQKDLSTGNDKPGGGGQVPEPGAQQGRNIAGDGNNSIIKPQKPRGRKAGN